MGDPGPMTTGTSRIPKSLLAAYAIARIADLGLIALGIGFIFLSETARTDLGYLIGWDVLALVYLTIGFVVVRRRRRRPDLIQLTGRLGQQWLTGARLGFGFTIAASLVGMGSADSVLTNGNDATYGDPIRFFGGVAIVAAWLLLHAGYARFYARRYYSSKGPADGDGTGVAGGLAFPQEGAPRATDFLYFSFTLCTSFAAS